MKADESRSPAPISVPLKHQHEHALPTVIHHPEDDLPLLARWLDRAMANRTRFWGLVGALVLVAIGLSVLGTGLSLGRATSDEAWTRLQTAKTPGERVEIAAEFPKTQAGRWALLQAASEYFNQGFNDLPANRDAAVPALSKALDLFRKVADEAPVDSPPARVAALGLARTLEAQSKLDQALQQYEKVAQTKAWAGTEEARTAGELAQALKSPDAAQFYKDLYAYKPAEATLPPGGVGNLPISLPPDHPPIGGSSTGTLPFSIPGLTGPSKAGEPSLLDVPPPPPTPPPAAGESKAGTPAATALPPDPFAPTLPKAEAPKANRTAPGLPADVFSPPSK